MKVYYWSPHLSKIGTIKAVYNSCKILRNNGIDAKIINAIGEWSHIEQDLRIDLFKKNNFYKILSNGGFIKSRIANIFIFIVAFFPLLRLLRSQKPNFIMIHLITSLPLILKKIFSFNSSIILRISGKVKFGILRKLLWKSVSSQIIVTSPTEETKKILIDKKIILGEKIYILKDPILESLSDFKHQELNLRNRNKFLSVGRLTKQKNFSFLINSFSILVKKFEKITLTIIGENAEEQSSLENLIIKKNLQKNVFLLGYKKNINSLYKEYDCFILSSLYEDPGAVLVEAANSFLPIISSDCPSGPKEILEYGKNGFLFKTNDQNDFLKTFEKYMNASDLELKNKILNLNKKIQEYTCSSHFDEIETILKRNL